VAGNLDFELGNGDNTVTITNAPGGTLIWNSGTGNNLLTLGTMNTPASETWAVKIQFGAGDDTLTLSTDPAFTQFITGTADGGGHIAGNVFNNGFPVWQVSPPGSFTVTNFP
jgi:hypothetical protein